jgi:hypothetical protein
VSPEGVSVFRASNHDEITQMLRVEGAVLLADRWQAGAGIPYIRRSVARPGTDAEASAIGDVRLNLAYEVLPEWSYSVWQPQGFVFLQAILPTGRSIYESKQSGAVDAIGQGFYTAALGAVFFKNWGNWDAYAIPEFHYSLNRSFDDLQTGDAVNVFPRWGASVAMGTGVSPGGGRVRVGLRIQPVYAARKRVVSNSGESFTSAQLSWETGLELGYVLADQWSLSAAYFDQTLLGPASGTTLARGVSVSLQHRWPR